MTAGTQTITATDTVDASITGTSNDIAVSAAAATHFSVNAPSSATAGSAFNFTVTALDGFNNTDTAYGGTVTFPSTDGGATLPSDTALSSGPGTCSRQASDQLPRGRATPSPAPLYNRTADLCKQ